MHRVPKVGRLVQGPPLMLTLPSRTERCHSREPQFPQKAQSSVSPVDVGRVQERGTPLVRRTAGQVTITEIPNAEADCLRHSRQWQT
ncbi:MAG TPA: hypothetical protein VHL31_23905 [Geminicoccus sp.]|jgi:hypothetical protein|nr:hypothetical protein [Geminicoccus sp.]HEX2529324.1 hypothetical protein [Geminicoccus sp.]